MRLPRQFVGGCGSSAGNTLPGYRGWRDVVPPFRSNPVENRASRAVVVGGSE
jgi:hypothetical protein